MAPSAKLQHLIERLGAPLQEQREEAQRALMEHGKEAVAKLAEAVAKHPERDVRAGAALCLGRMGAKEAAGVLCAVATSDKTDESLRPLVLRAICDLAGPDAPGVVKRTLLAHLDADDIFTRALACTGLGRIEDQECTEALQRAREDPEDWVREAAGKALERLSATEGDPDQILDPPQTQASEQALIPAAQALRSVARQLGSPDLAARRQALATLADRGEGAVQAVKPLLDNRLSPGRIGAIEVLGVVGATEGMALLLPLLEEGSAELLPAVLHAMARILVRNRSNRDQVGAFPKDQVSVYLDDQDDLVRAAAHAAMVAAGPTERRAAVEACLSRQEDEWVLASLAKTLSQVAGPQDRWIIQQLVDLLARLTEADSQLHLILALERVLSDPVPDDAQLVGPVSYFLHVEDRSVRLSAAQLICRVAQQVDPATLTGLLDLLPVVESGADRILLIRSIGRFAHSEDPAAVEAMSGLLYGEDQEVAREAARALIQLGSESAVDLLVGAANSQQGAVVTIAAQQLASMDPKSRVVGVRRADGRWERKIQHWCECGGALTWVSRGDRQELRCPQCDREYVVSSAGKLFWAERAPLGVCLCRECKRKQPLIRRGDSDTLVCPVTGNTHIRPFDHPNQIKLLTELPLGACRCCAEPQPLIRVNEQVICYRTRQAHRAAARGFILEGEEGAGVQTEGDIAAINQALLEGTIGIGESGVAVQRSPQDEEPDTDR